jgi:hypothetical protein
MIAPILTFILTGKVHSIAYALCDAQHYIYAGKTITSPLVLGPSQSVTILGMVKAVTVKGTVTVVDGCTVIIYPTF